MSFFDLIFFIQVLFSLNLLVANSCRERYREELCLRTYNAVVPHAAVRAASELQLRT